jgi:hypothetical protein
MKKLFLMFAMAGSIYAAAQSQMIASQLSEDSVVVQPSEVCDTTQVCATQCDTACCDTTACAKGSSAANGEADHTRVWMWTAIALLAVFVAIFIRRNNRLSQL